VLAGNRGNLWRRLLLPKQIGQLRPILLRGAAASYKEEGLISIVSLRILL
jgi:hypothetical protein